jgi:hypothetical protein
MPIAERQSELVADHLQGRYGVPSARQMQRDIEAKKAKMRKRYVASKRHTIQVDFDDYMRELTKERKVGAKRSASDPLRPTARPTLAAASAAASA